jgi:hypothetical protein
MLDRYLTDLRLAERNDARSIQVEGSPVKMVTKNWASCFSPNGHFGGEVAHHAASA